MSQANYLDSTPFLWKASNPTAKTDFCKNIFVPSKSILADY